MWIKSDTVDYASKSTDLTVIHWRQRDYCLERFAFEKKTKHVFFKNALLQQRHIVNVTNSRQVTPTAMFVIASNRLTITHELQYKAKDWTRLFVHIMSRTAQISKEKRQSIITLRHEGQSIREHVKNFESFFKCSCKNHQALWWNWLTWGPPQERKTQSYLCCRGWVH